MTDPGTHRPLTAAVLSALLLTLLPGGRSEEPPAAESQPAPAESEPSEPQTRAEIERILRERIQAGPVVDTSTTDEPGELTSRALEAYWSAREAVLGRDFEAGIQRLAEAIQLDPGFGEAWYQLGETYHADALAQAATAPELAVAQERRAVEMLREANRLIGAGSVRVADAFELDDLRTSLTRRLAQIDPLPETDADIVQRLKDLVVETEGEPPVIDFDMSDEGEEGELDGEAGDASGAPEPMDGAEPVPEVEAV